MPELQISSRQHLDYLRWKFILRVLWVHHYTGIWASPAHPYLRSYRFCFSSSAPTRTIVGNHVPFNPKPTRSLP